MAKNNWENYTSVRNWKASLQAGGAFIFGLGTIGEIFSGNIADSLASLVATVGLVGYMGYVNHTGSFLVPQPKPAPAQAK